MKTIKFNILLFAIILIFGCNSNNKNKEVLKKDSTKLIVEKSDFTNKFQLENCNCEENPELKDYISCKETVFSNGAKIYRQFNCDSSWLVFENKKIKKNIYSLEKELIDLTHRLGYVGWVEYEKSILIADRLWSGSGSPFEYHLFDKETGEKNIDLGQPIYFNEEQINSYFISLDTIQSKIRIYDLDTRKSAFFPFNLSKINSSKELGYFLAFPEELFSGGEIKNNIFKIEYSYRIKGKEDELSEQILIDLNKLNFN
jgi:hypothetical protein